MENYKNPNSNYFNSSIDASLLSSNQTPFTLAPTPQPQDMSGVIQSTPTYDEILAKINQPLPQEQSLTSSQTKVQDLIKSITEKGGSVGTNGIDTAQAQEKARNDYLKSVGFTGNVDAINQLRDVNTRLSALKRQETIIPLETRQALQGSGATLNESGIYSARKQEANALEALKQATIGEAIQGNIANAENYANELVRNQFAPLEAQLKAEQFNYQMNKDLLDRADKKRSDQLNFAIQERARKLEEEKTDKKTILGFVAEASKNGAPAILVQRASNLNSPAEALSVLSQYMSDPMAKQQALADLAFKRAQTAKVYSDMALSKEELALKRQSQATTQVVDPVTGKPTSELKIDARNSANELLRKFDAREGTAAVGKSRIIYPLGTPSGSKARDFEVNFDNLKSLLSLENIKLLKGQGQVSDAERKLLADASSQLSLGLSEPEFRKVLVKTSIGLGNPQEVTLTDSSGVSQIVLVDADTLAKAQREGLTVTY